MIKIKTIINGIGYWFAWTFIYLAGYILFGTTGVYAILLLLFSWALFKITNKYDS